MFWNRYEVYMGFDIKRFNQVLDILAMENIRYKFRTTDQSSRTRGAAIPAQSVGTAGENMNFSLMYYVYVHKKDAKIADDLISQRIRP